MLGDNIMADMPKMPEGGIVPRRDIKPLADEIQAILDGAGMGEGAPAPASSGTMNGEQAPATGASMPSEAPAAGGAQVIADVLGVSMEKAQALLDAAMAMPKLANKSPEEIAMMLEKDMNLRMQLEKSMGAGEDMNARKAMAESGMKAPPPTEPSMIKK
jgi:hypothetical protein